MLRCLNKFLCAGARLAGILLPSLALLLLLAGDAWPADRLPDYPAVTPDHTLHFPHDHGSHPAFRTEWWYITGWSHADGQDPLGFQVTFFRSRPPLVQGDPSHFAPDQLLFAHAAIADPAVGHLLHDQRAARAGFGLAEAAVGDTRVQIDDWSLERQADGHYHTLITAADFTLELNFTPASPLLLEGDAGYSRKGPLPAQASYYYSQPQLLATGQLTRNGVRRAIDGTAWLDHEWSSEVLAADAVGWDWTGINLDDGGALMAFRIRDRTGATLWAGGTVRQADGRARTLAPADVAFKPRRLWRSPATGADYPVAMRLRAGDISVNLDPLMDDQELNSRASTGAVYWEGAVTAMQDGQAIGRGYLELTGYFRPLQF